VIKYDGVIDHKLVLSLLESVSPKNNNNIFSNTYVDGKPENGKKVVHPGFQLKIPLSGKMAGLLNTAMKSHQKEGLLHFSVDLKFSKNSEGDIFALFKTNDDFFSDVFKRPSIAQASFDTESFARYYAMYFTTRHLSLSGVYQFPKNKIDNLLSSLPHNKEINDFLGMHLKDRNKGADGLSDRETLNSDFGEYQSLKERIGVAVNLGVERKKAPVQNKEELKSSPSFISRRA